MNCPRTIGASIRVLSIHIKRFIDNHTAKSHIQVLTGVQHAVIGYLGDRSLEQDIFQKDIENEFNIRRSTATGILQLMEKNGLLKREPVPSDARLKKVILTEKALHIHESIKKDITEMEQVMTDGLTEEELDTFFSVIDKISMNIEKSQQG